MVSSSSVLPLASVASTVTAKSEFTRTDEGVVIASLSAVTTILLLSPVLSVSAPPALAAANHFLPDQMKSL